MLSPRCPKGSGVSPQPFYPRVNEIRPRSGSFPGCPLRPLPPTPRLCSLSSLQGQTCFSSSTDVHGIPITLSPRTFAEHKPENWSSWPEEAYRKESAKHAVKLNYWDRLIWTLPDLWEADMFRPPYFLTFATQAETIGSRHRYRSIRIDTRRASQILTVSLTAIHFSVGTEWDCRGVGEMSLSLPSCQRDCGLTSSRLSCLGCLCQGKSATGPQQLGLFPCVSVVWGSDLAARHVCSRRPDPWEDRSMDNVLVRLKPSG